MTSLDCGGRDIDLSRPVVMGILNITPDSFSDGGKFLHPEKAIDHAASMIDAGADMIDIGAESTRPGASKLNLQEELDRLLPVLAAITERFDVPVSVDTYKPEVMRAASRAGAGMINDVYGLRAEGALAAAVDSGLPVCIMHMQGEPQNMQKNPSYQNVVGEIIAFLEARIKAAIDAGIERNRIIVDPGFGFGKTLEHNIALLRGLADFQVLDLPILVGLSRKSMIGALLGNPVDQRCNASVVLALIAAQQGARILRVHDVAETVEAIKILNTVFA